jgi:hypothetical protein
LVSERLLEKKAAAIDVEIDGRGLSCLTSVTHKVFKYLKIHELPIFIDRVLDPASQFTLPATAVDVEQSSRRITTVMQEISEWYTRALASHDGLALTTSALSLVSTRVLPPHSYQNVESRFTLWHARPDGYYYHARMVKSRRIKPYLAGSSTDRPCIMFSLNH